MYIIKSWTRDFRDEETRKNDYSCYKETEKVVVDKVFGIIPITKSIGKPGTFIEGRNIQTYEFKHKGLMFHTRLIKCQLCNDFTETAYIPDTREEYIELEAIAKDVIKGKYLNQPERAKNLRRAGYDYFKVQSFVNHLLKNYDLFEEKDWGDDIADEDPSDIFDHKIDELQETFFLIMHYYSILLRKHVNHNKPSKDEEMMYSLMDIMIGLNAAYGEVVKDNVNSDFMVDNLEYAMKQLQPVLRYFKNKSNHR